MVRKKACKSCKIFVEGTQCPLCGSKDLTTSWKGRIIIEDPVRSEIAQKLSIKIKGEYSIRTK
jgi:DNA-directed RNA polymerase subunit E"